jgi:hypothetical protein
MEAPSVVCLVVPCGLLEKPITNTDEDVVFWVAPDELLQVSSKTFRFLCVGWRLKQSLLLFPTVCKQLETTHMELDTGFLQLTRDIRGIRVREREME